MEFLFLLIKDNTDYFITRWNITLISQGEIELLMVKLYIFYCTLHFSECAVSYRYYFST